MTKVFVFLCRRLAIVLCAAMASTAAAAGEHAIESVLLQAMSNHPVVRASMAQAQAAEQDIDVAKLGRWPSVQVTGEATASANGSALVVEQPLWSAGAITARIGEAQRAADLRKSELDLARLQLGLRLVDAWQSLMDATGSLRVYEQSLVQYERYEALMRRRVDAQVSAGIELQLLASRTLQARVDVSEAQALKRMAVTRLEQMTGAPIVPEQLVALAQTVAPAAIEDESTAVRLERRASMLSEHPSVRRARHESEVAQERLTQQRALAWPQLVLRYRRQLTGIATTAADKEQIGLVLNYTPGAGFSSVARSAADAQRLEGLQLATESAAQDVQEQLRIEWESLRRDIDRQGVQRQAIGSAREVLESYERQFVAGRKSWLDVLNALRDLTQSDIRLTQAQASATAGLYRLRLRSGALPSDTYWKVQP